jgi:hypothetical protein
MNIFNGTPCMPWPGYLSPDGYGYLSVNNHTRRVHRAVYENVKGKIPPGLVLDHLCRNRSCVNPDHLEIVTPKVNVLRGETITARNAKKTHCVHGHSLDAPNIYLHRGRRMCLACNRRRCAAYAKKGKS